MGGFFSFGGTNTQATNQNKEQTSLGNTQNTGQTSPSVPSLPPTNQRVVKISSLSIGYSHFCIISSGSLYCAGTNSSGEIGLPGSISSSSRLTKVSDLDGIVSISNGDQFSCALFDDFTASCFGDNTLNKLSSDEFGNLVDSFGSVIENIAQISAGKDSACLVTNTGDLYCWGKNNAGQLGKPENTEPNSAKKVVTTEKFKRVIVSSEHACAITFNNRLYCWGSNQFGKLGINLSGDRSEPTLVSELEEVLDFALGQNHTCAISKEGASGRLYCWGSNDLGQLLSLEEKTFRKPVLLSTDKFTSIVSTERAICAKGLDNSGSCWGEISFSGDGVYTSELTKYPGMESISELFGSANGVCFTSKSNDLFCLGNNESKQYEQSLSSFITIPKKIAISGLN
jgi:alpha-tubulin suppressor-like RCC1 family protein